jgi:hypothetical protein
MQAGATFPVSGDSSTIIAANNQPGYIPQSYGMPNSQPHQVIYNPQGQYVQQGGQGLGLPYNQPVPNGLQPKYGDGLVVNKL